ncbi:Leucine-rich repeat protein kinase family protein [Euphorbia peplus]|nr:Leucine-rich repeat protein kinase family protein [Euphorbia peplus]
MNLRISVFLLLVPFRVYIIAAVTNSLDASSLNGLKSEWQNTPPNWVGADPCGDRWDGIKCTNSRVTTIKLSSLGVQGPLSGEISSLLELQILDLSSNKGLRGPLPASIGNLKKLTNLILIGCSFSGPLPDSIGSLERLVTLDLNSNAFTGPIPPSIGILSNLHWLDLANNSLSGTIPVSTPTTPGLDMLRNTKHFHFGKNHLSGTIPAQLFSSEMTLIHVLFENNNFTGSIPSTLGLVKTLEVLRFDRNLLTGPVPLNINNLTSVTSLYLSNNGFTGPVPDLSGMNLLNVEMSNNSFDASVFPSWIPTMQSLTTLMMEGAQLEGQVRADLFSLNLLQTVLLSNNQLNGTLDLGTNNANQLQLVDLQNNQISGYTNRPGRSSVNVILLGNPICKDSGIEGILCTIPPPPLPTSTYKTPTNNCVPATCSSNQNSSPNCRCAYPYTGLLLFRAPLFSDFENSTVYESLENALMHAFKLNQLPIDSVSISNPRKDSSEYLHLDLQMFPASQVSFNRTIISDIGFVLSNQTFKPPRQFGPFYFLGNTYQFNDGSNKSSNSGIIIGAAAGVSALFLLLLIAGFYAYHQKKKAKTATKQNEPFANWDSSKNQGAQVPQLKGTRSYSFDEIKKYTNNFSDANDVGSGGYGKVYRGILANGQLIAIKRAQHGSLQGGVEFKNEIELLSRVHHKNLVSLLGFCFEQGEQMLVYEFVANGSLSDSLSGKLGVRMNWIRRLKVTLGAARGLAYLHELANPPIIHRDIKSTNILLDERLNAKVADFGLSKPLSDTEKSHVTTQVKGTMGYMDPEYYMTQQLTEKSDVYSFGVVMLEILTGRKPIERGRYIVREVKIAMDRTKDLYNLHELLDPGIGLETSLQGINKFVDLAMKCVQESGSDRPAMGEVVKGIENILQLAGLNPNAESASTSASYEEARMGSPRHPYNKDAFEYSAAFPSSKIEPH